MNRVRRIRRAGVVLGVAALLLSSAAVAQPKGAAEPPPRDWARELDTKITGPFTVAAVGDMIINRPVSMINDAGLQAFIKLIRAADLGVGNFETNIHDEQTFVGPLRLFNGDKSVAADLKAMGFRILGRANNHAWDSGQEGFFETSRLLSEAGVVHAGGGRDLDEARAARFIDTPQGRVGLVSVHPPINPQGIVASATRRVGDMGGGAGVNPLRVSRTVNVTAEQLAEMKRVRDQVYEGRVAYSWPKPAPVDPAGRLDLFGTSYKVGRPGQTSWVMNREDLDGNLAAIRAGKQSSHFMMAMIHAHENENELERPHMGEIPPDYLVQFARATIDNGADMFIGTGPHMLRGVEIYKGKPIFYSLGEAFQDIYATMYPFDERKGRTSPEMATAFWDSDFAGGSGLKNKANLESVVAVSKFDRGRLQEVRLYPIDLRWEAPVVDNGLPRLASPPLARAILERMQRLSAALGTKVVIEGNVGIIRVAN